MNLCNDVCMSVCVAVFCPFVCLYILHGKNLALDFTYMLFNQMFAYLSWLWTLFTSTILLYFWWPWCWVRITSKTSFVPVFHTIYIWSWSNLILCWSNQFEDPDIVLGEISVVKGNNWCFTFCIQKYCVWFVWMLWTGCFFGCLFSVICSLLWWLTSLNSAVWYWFEWSWLSLIDLDLHWQYKFARKPGHISLVILLQMCCNKSQIAFSLLLKYVYT